MQIPTHHPVTSPFTPSSSSAANANSSTSGSSSSSSSSTSSSTSSAAITANDFLQLLVTELQNQDPTADTDPNEYVDQLVQVNSLQQLIQMNQTLDGGPTLTGASSGVLQQLNQMNQTLDGDVSSSGAQVSSGHTSALSKPHTATAGGNLSPVLSAKSRAAAEQVASALSPRSKQPVGTGAETGQMQALEQFAARLRANAQ